jgi:hypothetical protein
VSEQEIAALRTLAEAWNLYLKYRTERGAFMHSDDDINDFRFHIHAAQNIIMSGCTRRDYPTIFNVE